MPSVESLLFLRNADNLAAISFQISTDIPHILNFYERHKFGSQGETVQPHFTIVNSFVAH